MKFPYQIQIGICIAISSCNPNKTSSTGSAPRQVTAIESNILSLTDLRKHQTAYVGKQVTVAAYLFTHEEGPWLQSAPKPQDEGMPLQVGDTSTLLAKDAFKPRMWFEYQEGYPVILSGVFRVGNFKAGPMSYKDRPFIEVSVAQEVSPDDPIWIRHQSTGEQKPPSSK